MRKLSIRAPFAISALLASAWSPVTAAPSGDAVVIRAGEVIVRPGEVMKDVDVLVIDGVIRRVAAEIEAPEGARELSGAVVCAGFLDPWSVLGINATDVSFTSVSPSTRTADAIDPFGQEFQKKQALEAGVTAVRVQASHRALVSGLPHVVEHQQHASPLCRRLRRFAQRVDVVAVAAAARARAGVRAAAQLRELRA